MGSSAAQGGCSSHSHGDEGDTKKVDEGILPASSDEHKHGDDGHKHGDDGHGHDHGHSHNSVQNKLVSAAFLHALTDMIMSIGVIIAAAIILYNPEWTIADPICTFVFSVIVLLSVTPIIKDCIYILMEGAPSHIDSDALVKEINAIGEDIEVHDFHIW